MHSKTVPLIIHPNFTKITALFLGYTIWLFCSNYQWVSMQYTVPVCFFHNEQQILQAPESVMIKIFGPRNQMHNLHRDELAIHLDVSDLKDGTHEIMLEASNLFLPETLKLVELIPATISCTIQTTQTT
jgi:YbbR domain-containing protein